MSDLTSVSSEADQRFQSIYQTLRTRIVLLDYVPGAVSRGV